MLVAPSISLPSSVKKHDKDFRGSVPCPLYHKLEPGQPVWACQHMGVNKWNQRMNVKGKISLLRITLPFQKGVFNFITLISTVSKKWPREKGFPQGSIYQQEGSMHAVWWPVKESPWIHTVRSAAVEVQVSTPTALYQHPPSLCSAVQLKCFFSLWEPLTTRWFRVHGCWWESLGPRTRHLCNSCWFSSDKIRLNDNCKPLKQ